MSILPINMSTLQGIAWLLGRHSSRCRIAADLTKKLLTIGSLHAGYGVREQSWPYFDAMRCDKYLVIYEKQEIEKFR